jgi:hypothetical protein
VHSRSSGRDSPSKVMPRSIESRRHWSTTERDGCGARATVARRLSGMSACRPRARSTLSGPMFAEPACPEMTTARLPAVTSACSGDRSERPHALPYFGTRVWPSPNLAAAGTPRRFSHPDWRSILTSIVARHSRPNRQTIVIGSTENTVRSMRRTTSAILTDSILKSTIRGYRRERWLSGSELSRTGRKSALHIP